VASALGDGSPVRLRCTDFVALLDQRAAAYGTAERVRPLVAVLDNGPTHRALSVCFGLPQVHKA